MQTVIIDLQISADEYVKNYQSLAAVVVARSRDGLRVKFPASLLQPFVSHSGIQGCFKIAFDGAGKFQRIERLTPV